MDRLDEIERRLAEIEHRLGIHGSQPFMPRAHYPVPDFITCNECDSMGRCKMAGFCPKPISVSKGTAK